MDDLTPEQRKKNMRAIRSKDTTIEPKIERNMKRDREVTATLVEQGWIVLRFWEHTIRKELEECVEDIQEAVEIRKEIAR